MSASRRPASFPRRAFFSAVGVGAALLLVAGAAPADASVLRVWQRIPAAAEVPLSRSEIGGIYDPLRDRLVFFGGLRGDPLDETWSYDFASATWTQYELPVLPARRTNHAAVYDPSRDRMLIFGGERDEDIIHQDTWAFDLATNTWSELFTVGSFPKTEMVSAYDAVRDRLWVALGFTVGGQFDTTVGYLDLATNVWTVVPNVGTVPEQRIGAFGEIDPVRDRLVLYGGNDREDYYENTFYFDLETFEWSLLPEAEVVPAERAFGRMLYDAPRDRMLIFGGNEGGDFFNEVWAFTLDNERWSLLRAEDSEEEPSTRNGALFVHDTTRDVFVVFAGQKRGERRNDVWQLVDRAGGTGSGALRVNGHIAPETFEVSPGDRLDVELQGRLEGGARYVLFADVRAGGSPAALPGGIPFCFDPRPSSPEFALGTMIVCDTVGVSVTSGPLAGLDPPLRPNCPLAPPAPDFARLISDRAVNAPAGRAFTLQAVIRDPARAGGFGATEAIRVTVR